MGYGYENAACADLCDGVIAQTDSGAMTSTHTRDAAVRVGWDEQANAYPTGVITVAHMRAGDASLDTYGVRVLRWRSCHVITSVVLGGISAGRAGMFRTGDIACEFFWAGRWWNVIAGYDPANGDLRGYYCNISLPPRWSADGDTPRVIYTDLELDLLVFPDGTIELQDEDEFAHHAETYPYPATTVVRAWAALDDLRARIARRAHPFRYESLPALVQRLRLPPVAAAPPDAV